MDGFHDRLHLILLCIAIFLDSCSGYREKGRGIYRRQATHSSELHENELLGLYQPPLIDRAPGPLRYLLPDPQPASIFFAANSHDSNVRAEHGHLFGNMGFLLMSPLPKSNPLTLRFLQAPNDVKRQQFEHLQSETFKSDFGDIGTNVGGMGMGSVGGGFDGSLLTPPLPPPSPAPSSSPPPRPPYYPPQI